MRMRTHHVSPPEHPRIIVADDEVLVREGLGLLLGRTGYEVAGSAADAVELLDLVDSVPCDLAIVDIRMPPTHTTEGLEAAARIRATHPEVAVLVLTSHLEVPHALKLLSEHTRIGYLLKQRIATVDELTTALHRLLSGESVVDPILVRELLTARRAAAPLQDLTPRESETLELMAAGRSNAGIAADLTITEASVEKYVHRILGKLGVTDGDGSAHRRVVAVLKFLEVGSVPDQRPTSPS
jgi:DNA-binding NarL/FixJ family response regulator